MQTLQQVENYTALSERASEYLLAVIRSKPNAVICLATGATPLLTYHYLVEKEGPEQHTEEGERHNQPQLLPLFLVFCFAINFCQYTQANNSRDN